MASKIKSFLKNNYFEKIEFTKAETILMVVIILVFLPLGTIQIEDEISGNAELKAYEQLSDDEKSDVSDNKKEKLKEIMKGILKEKFSEQSRNNAKTSIENYYNWFFTFGDFY